MEKQPQEECVPAVADAGHLRLTLERGDVDSFMTYAQSYLASIPSVLIRKHEQERNFHVFMHLLSGLTGVRTMSEYSLSNGRIDLIVETAARLYIFEFKCDCSSTTALRQILEKGYEVPWRKEGKGITVVGVNFSSHTHNIESWEWRPLPTHP